MFLRLCLHLSSSLFSVCVAPRSRPSRLAGDGDEPLSFSSGRAVGRRAADPPEQGTHLADVGPTSVKIPPRATPVRVRLMSIKSGGKLAEIRPASSVSTHTWRTSAKLGRHRGPDRPNTLRSARIRASAGRRKLFTNLRPISDELEVWIWPMIAQTAAESDQICAEFGEVSGCVCARLDKFTKIWAAVGQAWPKSTMPAGVIGNV